MLILGIFLLILLNLHEINAGDSCGCSKEKGYFEKATENVTDPEEWKEINATFKYTSEIPSYSGIILDINKHGKTIDKEIQKMRNLDALLWAKDWRYKHLNLCLGNHNLLNKTYSELSPLNRTILEGYERFHSSLLEIPIVDVDLKKIKAGLYYTSEKNRQDNVASQLAESIPHFQCLQKLTARDERRMIERLTLMLEIWLYFKSHIIENEIREKNERIFSCVAFFFLVVGIALFSKAFRRLCRKVLNFVREANHEHVE